MNMKRMMMVIPVVTMAFYGNAETTFTTEVDGSTWSYTLSVSKDGMTTNATITAVTPANGALVVPSLVDGYRVTAIGNNVGKGCGGITSLRIPDSVSAVGYGAFAECASLGWVVLGNGVTKMNSRSNASSYPVPTPADFAFGGCTALTNVVFGSSLKEMYGSFCKCTALERVVLPDSLERLGHDSFFGCANMVSVSLGPNLTSIGRFSFQSCTQLRDVVFRASDSGTLEMGACAFKDCTALTNLTFAGSLMALDSEAFRGCKKLERVVFPDSLQVVEAGAFAECTSLKEVVLGDGLTTMNSSNNSASNPDPAPADFAFGGCTALTNVVFGSSLTVLYGSFCKCTALERVVLPDSLMTLGPDSFLGCTKMTFASLGPNLTSIGAYSFQGCTRLREVDFRESNSGALVVDACAFKACTALERVTFSNALKSLGGEAFRGCSALKRVDLPNSLRTVEHGVFAECTSLREVVLGDGLTTMNSSDNTSSYSNPASADFAFGGCTALTNIVFGSSLKEMYGSFCKCTALARVELPDSLVTLGSDSFFGCTSLKEAVINAGLKRIGEYAFHGATALNTVTFQPCDDAKLVIERCAFEGCSKLMAVQFSNALTNISDGAFRSCGALKRLVLPNSLVNIGAGAFANCTSLLEVSLGDGLVTISGDGNAYSSVNAANYAFGGCSSLTNIIFGTSLKSMYGAFCNCKSLPRVVVPDSVETIGPDTFFGCTGMTEAVIGTGVKRIGGYAFYGATALKTVTFQPCDDAKLSIEGYAFSNCAKLETIRFSNALTSLNGAFRSCTSLVRVDLPNSLQTIGSYTFAECTKLTSVCFGANVKTIGGSAFANCPYLRYLHFLGDPPTSVGSGAFNKLKSLVVVYREDGNGTWPTTWRGCHVKPISEITPDPDAPWDLQFYKSNGWPSGFFLTATTNSLEECTRHLEGDPIYATYGCHDGWQDFNITQAFTNTLYLSGTTQQGISWYNGLAVGRSATANSCLWPILQNLGVGEYTVTWVLNDPRSIPETDYANNSNSVTFLVVPSTAITFVSAGEEILKKNFEKGAPYGKLPVPPSRYSLNFSGWYTAEEGGDPVTTESIVPKSPTTLYSHWEFRPMETNRVREAILADATWRMGDLYVVEVDLTIPSGVTLTIEPGVVVKFAAGKSLTVKSGGTLSAIGMSALPIVLTSINDDEHGGDANGDGEDTLPAGGDWQGIWVYGKADFAFAKMMYAGPSNERGIIQTSDSGVLTMDSCVVAHSKFDGIWNWGGKIRVSNSIITDTGWAAAPFRGNQNEYVNCVFYGNNVALCYWSHWSGRPVFKNCIFAECVHGWCETASGRYGDPPSAVSISSCLFYSSSDIGLQSSGRVGKNGNIWGDPLFVDPETGDFRVATGSPCVDAADGAAAPETDYFGRMRMDVPSVRDKGTLAANGAVPDIGIYEVSGDGYIPSPDMTVTAVTCPEAFNAGEKIEVAWTVKNVGDEPVLGVWRDEVELVAVNGQVFSMGTVVSQTMIKPDATADFKTTVTVPAAPSGIAQIRVTANKYQDLFEALKVSNNKGETNARLGVPTRAVPSDGTATAISLDGDSETGFALDGGDAVATQGGVLVIRGAGELDAWLGNGNVAGRDNAIRTAVKIADDTWLLQIPAGSEPYVTIRNGGEDGVSTSLSLEVGGFFLLDTGKVSAVNSGMATVAFAGNGFDDTITCWLERKGIRIDARERVIESGVSASATFSVSGCEAGDWELHVKKGDDEASAVLLTLTERKVGAKWGYRVNVASTIRKGRVYVGSVEYGNSGDTAMPAPYLRLTATPGTFIRLSEADAWTDSLELMATSSTNPARLLKPGETEKIEFFYTMSASHTGNAAHFDVRCDATFASAEDFPWDTNAAYMHPSWATDDAWGIMLATLKSNVGRTWNDFLDRMRANCDHLMKIGQPTRRLDRLWQLEINEALGVDHAVQTLAGGTDLARFGRGFGLSFSRTYGAAMFKRFKKGVLGYGWTDNFSTYAELIDQTTLAFHLPSGATYQFHKVSGKWAPEDAGDKTTLSETSSAYILTYRSDTVQTIAKSNMRTSSILDNQGNELTFVYSGSLLQKVQHSDGQSLTFTYSGDKVAFVTDDQGRTVTYGYTGDLLTSVTAFNGLVTQYAYYPHYPAGAGQTARDRALKQIIYPDGTTKDYTYDTYGRVATASVNGREFTTEIVRGRFGSYSIIAPNGGVTEVTVGASGETLKAVNALGQVVEQKYTEDTLLESVIAPSGKRNKITYNKDGAPIQLLTASGVTTALSYESGFDNLSSVTDAKGHSINYGYDRLGRGNSISYVDDSSSSLKYNEKGDVARATNRRGETIEYEYDAEGNLVKKTWSNGRTFTLAYDAKGNVTNAADSVTGTVTMEYDANERLTRIVYPKGRGFTYTYDDVGRVKERTMLGGSPSSATATQRYTYDSLGRLSRVTDGDNNPYLTNAYDPTTGWLITQTYGNGTIVSNAYDILGRTVGIYHLVGRGVLDAPPLAFFEYVYDVDGKCISQTTAEGTESYTYDADGQLTAVTYPDGTSETFTYDAVGNRITHTGTTGVSPVEETYTVNALNQYTTLRDSASPREETLTYDLDGNMTRNGDTYYTYDTLNRLVAVTNEAENIRWSCEYDVFGNRISVTDNGTTTERLFVQGSFPSVAAEFTGDTLSKSHILVGAVRLADISRTGGSPVQARYYHADMLGSARLLTDGTGATKGTRSFKAFGQTRVSTGETTDAGYIGTLGVETDPNGLLFMRNRYYEAGMGRFTQMDPIGLRGRDVNLYRYCGNDVLLYIDPLGMEAICNVASVTYKGNTYSCSGSYPIVMVDGLKDREGRELAGQTDPANGRIKVRTGMSDGKTKSTIRHESGHMSFDDNEDNVNRRIKMNAMPPGKARDDAWYSYTIDSETVANMCECMNENEARKKALKDYPRKFFDNY